MNDFDLIVLGLPERIGYTQRLLGTVPQHIVQRSRLPTLLVQGPPNKFNRILICTGGLESAEKVINTGARIAEEVGARATLLYVSGAVPSMYTGLDEMEETLPELLETDTPLSRHLLRGAEILYEHGVKAELEIRHGVVTNGILREAVRGDHDLIVLGASGARNTLRGWILGDVTQDIVGNTPCPVLIVP
jgi:nucleotide-binding universal stress UspA family protein